MDSEPSGDRRPTTARLVQYGLTAVFGALIVAAFAHEAVEAAATFGWVAYPLVAGTGVVAFLLARLAWRARPAGAPGPHPDPERDASGGD